VVVLSVDIQIVLAPGSNNGENVQRGVVVVPPKVYVVEVVEAVNVNWPARSVLFELVVINALTLTPPRPEPSVFVPVQPTITPATPDPVTIPDVAAATNAVVANCVVFVPGAAVGAAGVPVNVGDANGAFNASAVSTYAVVANLVELSLGVAVGPVANVATAIESKFAVPVNVGLSRGAAPVTWATV